mgnify:CR=1 FL=1
METALSKELPGVTIYTDGGAAPNPGTGGWAAVLMWGGKERELRGGEVRTTNNRMELTAALEALAALKRRCRVELHTDSQYLQRGVTEWLPGWKRRNWRRKTGSIKNEDLWRALDAQLEKHEINWYWVRGHAGNHYNERCDALVGESIAELKQTGLRQIRHA